MIKSHRRAMLELGLVLSLFVVALVVRIYHLREIPPGLYHDEAVNGLDVKNILRGQHPIFFEGNNGREPLFIYLQAIFVWLLGPTPYALRLTAAVVGAATIPATYWMVREAFSSTPFSRWLAAWTAAFIAFSYWHISLSRIGLRAVMLPLMTALAFAFFWRAWWRMEKSGRLAWVELTLCGVFVAASLYTYTAGRFVPALVVIVALAGALGPGRSLRRTKQIGLGVLVIGFTAVVLFAPLGLYYMSHPEAFFGRAAFVSVFNRQSTGAHPLWALVGSVLKTLGMLVVLPDPNLRHNPAGRPVFDVVMFAWLAAGAVVAVWRWRVLPNFFALAWFTILAMPAVLTVEGAPHSLRAVGMIPAAYMLIVVAMLAARHWVAERSQQMAFWLPLPFLLFSGFIGVRDYFRAGMDPYTLREAFQVEFAEIAGQLRGIGQEDAGWILPVSTNYYVADAVFATFEFLAPDDATFDSVPIDETQAPERLGEATRGKRLAYLLLPQEMTRIPSAPYVFGDPKHLLEFLLGKYGFLTATNDSEAAGIPYATYEVPAEAEYPIHAGLTPSSLSFGGIVRLQGAAFGRTTLDLWEPAAMLNEKSAPAGHPLWAVLRWQPEAPIDIDLKASVYLKDESGHLAGQVDDLLVGDRYPVHRTWDASESASTYHIIPTLPALAPGRYGLYVKVYENDTGRDYPVVTPDGAVESVDALLGYVDITRSTGQTEVQPEHSIASDTDLGGDLRLLGYDLPAKLVRPGEELPVALYWQAPTKPARDYLISTQLRSSRSEIVAEASKHPVNGKYPTSQWQTGEIVRDWHDLPVPASVSSGTYSLTVSVSDGRKTLGSMDLGNVEVKGRRAVYETPFLTQPISVTFGTNVALLGILGPTELPTAPGQTVELTLAWQALSPSESELIRFVHVLGPDGRPVAQQDSVPCNGDCPAPSWQPGEVLIENVQVEMPGNIEPGEYPIGIGWYDVVSGARLPAYDATRARVADDVLQLPLHVLVNAADAADGGVSNTQ